MNNEKEENSPLLESSMKNKILFQNEDKCDKYDYLAALGFQPIFLEKVITHLSTCVSVQLPKTLSPGCPTKKIVMMLINYLTWHLIIII